MLIYVQMDENQKYPNNLVHLPTGYNPPLPEEDSNEWTEFEATTKSWSPERREKFLTHLVVPALIATGVVLLLKYSGGEKADIVKAAEEYAGGEVPIEQIAQELGVEDMMFYDGTIVLKPGSQLRTSPQVGNDEGNINDAGESSHDPNEPTTADKSLVAKDRLNPENGIWFSVVIEGKTLWTNQQNVVEFDQENIKHVNVQTAEEQQ
jgi:hypothetical protein